MHIKPAYYFKTASFLFQNRKCPISDFRLIAEIAYGDKYAMQKNCLK